MLPVAWSSRFTLGSTLASSGYSRKVASCIMIVSSSMSSPQRCSFVVYYSSASATSTFGSASGVAAAAFFKLATQTRAQATGPETWPLVQAYGLEEMRTQRQIYDIGIAFQART